MKRLFAILLVISLNVSAQNDLAFLRKVPDGGKIARVFWRQVAGTVPTTILNPDSLKTKITGLDRVGTYSYELAISFTNNNILSIAKDTVNVFVHPPTSDNVTVVTKTTSQITATVLSTINTTASIKVTKRIWFWTQTVQSYSVSILAGMNTVTITNLKSGYTTKITLNGKTYQL